MPADTTEIEHESDLGRPRTRAGKVRLRSLSDLDRRTAAARRANDLVAGLESDLGGADSVSVAQRELIKRVALAGALAEDIEVRWLQGDPIAVDDYTKVANVQRRLLATIGLQRLAHDISGDTALLRMYNEAANAGAAP